MYWENRGQCCGIMIKHRSSPSKFVETVMLLTCIQHVKLGQDSVVTISTCYGKNSRGIKFQWEKDFAHLFRIGLFPKVKRPVLGIDHPLPSRVKVKERVQLYYYYYYYCSGPSCPVVWWTYLIQEVKFRVSAKEVMIITCSWYFFVSFSIQLQAG